MSNQIVITSGAKLRDLDDVIVATDGILTSLAFNVANGVPRLDENGKILVSQLPNSVMEFKGVWNAATNSPTLVNGTGNAGDVWLCNVAGTVNFGAGPIAFAVGDYAVYTGSVWARSSGATGTVTSVGVSRDGNALVITGSPVTTSGTINLGFIGNNTQYINGAGNLTTFPTLTGYVPYMGATQDVDLGAFKLNAQSLHIKGTAGNGHLGLKHQSANATASANEVSLFADSLGDLSWLNGNLYLSKFLTSGNTANRSYTFPNANGTVALTSDISYPVTSVFGRTGAVVATSGDYTTTQVTEGTNLYFTNTRSRTSISLTTTGTSGPATYNNTTGVFNIPSYIGGVTSVFGRTGAVVATDGDYTLTLLGDVTITSPSSGQVLKYNGTAWINDTDANTGTVTSVAMTVPTGLSIAGSPITSSGTLALTFASGYSIPTNASQTTWDTAYTNRITSLTVTGSSGAATLISNVLNIPQYQAALTNPVTGTGTTNNLSKFTGTSTIGNANITDNGTFIEISASHLYVSPALKVWNDLLVYNSILFSNSTYVTQAKIIGDANSLYFDVNGGVTRSLTMSSNGDATFTAKVFATTGKFWDGTQGLTIQSHGSTYGGIYSASVTPSGTNYSFLTNGATTYLNSSTNMGLNINDIVKLWIDSAGFIGIGTVAPTVLLNVVNSANGKTAGFAGTAYGIRFDNGGAFSTGMSTIHGVDNTLTASYQPIMINGADVRFGINATEQMRLSSNGLSIGIFPHTTYGKLNVKSNSSTSYQGLNVYANANDRFIAVNHTGALGVIETENAGSSVMTDLLFRVNSTDMLKLTTGGTLLVKTTGITGGGALQVNGNVNINGVFQINGVTIGGGGGSGVTGSGSTGYHAKWSSTSSIVNSVIYDNGTNVGLNTTSPNKRLEVISGNGVNDGIRITYAAGVTSEGMDITYNNTGATTVRYDSIYDSSGAIVQFRMRTSNATPSNPLSLLGDGKVIVNGSSAISIGRLSIFAGGAAGVSWGSGLNIGDATDYLGFIQDGGTSRFRNFGSGGIEFFNNAASTIISFKNNGNVLIGTTTDAGYRLQVSGDLYVSGTAVYVGGVSYSGVQTFNNLVYLNSTTIVAVGQNITWKGSSGTTYDFSMGNGGLGMYIQSNAEVDLNAPIAMRYGLIYTFKGNGSSAYNVNILNSGIAADELQFLGGLRLNTTTCGFIPPKMTTTQKNALPSSVKVAGCIVYDTTVNLLQAWNGTSWNNLW